MLNQDSKHTSVIETERQLKDPIFIIGCPRSGTTLLQQMLDAHSDILITPETHFMQYFLNRREEYGDLNQDVNYQQLIQNIIALPEFSEMELSAHAFSEAAWRNERNYAAIFLLLLEKFAHSRGVQIVGKKTPNHVMHIPKLKQLFPSARFVNIVRDPRAVVNSWRSATWSNFIKDDSEVINS